MNGLQEIASVYLSTACLVVKLKKKKSLKEEKEKDYNPPKISFKHIL